MKLLPATRLLFFFWFGLVFVAGCFPLVVDHCVVNRNIFVDQHYKTRTTRAVNITTIGQMPNGQKA